jgi:uncharacterized protein (DUF849 family)
MLLKIALNGARPKIENENIPQAIEEIQKAVDQLFQLGYNVFHIHCYDKKGNESINPEDVLELITTVKKISSKIKIGISTGEWIEPDLTQRVKLIESWTVVPDFVSVNIIEDNVQEVTNALIKKGVTIEAGLSEKKAAEIFVNSNLKEYCERILIEPEEEILEEALVTVSAIESILNQENNKVKILLHGFNSASWGLIREAKRREYDSRIGLEDTIYLENGVKVKNNLELIMAAEKIIKKEYI